MIRILGIIVGAFLAASALVLFLGIPEFHRQDVSQARMVAAIENAQSRWDEREAPAPTAIDETPDEPVPDAVVTSPPTEVANVAPVETVHVETLVPAEPEWHAIWTPFRTEIAARGFVSRLESVTGLDYRVEKRGKGAWQVAFAYEDDDKLHAGLDQIAAATGLDLAADRR